MYEEEQKERITRKIYSRFGELLDSGLGTDTLIEVGKEPNIKSFRAHSFILFAVSPYFQTALSKPWVHKVDDKIHYKKPNISPKIFEMILNFIYKAELNLKQQKVADICSLIKASDELSIDILNEHILECVLQDPRRLIDEDPVNILQIIFRYDYFSDFRETFLRITCENPEKLITSIKFNNNFDKSIIVQLIKRDDLIMEEVNIWKHLLEYAIFKTKLDINKVKKWKSEDFSLLREILQDFIPHIRWFQITGKDFWYNVKPFKKVLPKEMYDDILGYNIDNSIQPKSFEILQKRQKPLNLSRKLVVDYDEMYRRAKISRRARSFFLE
ncbi:15563_t:CDS:2 [Funneliformis geosporum]|nr:15563_t:CDS:2 [Funneliformis geosporum]